MTTTPESITTTTIVSNQTTIEPTTPSTSETIPSVTQTEVIDQCIEDDCPIIESGVTEWNLTLLANPFDCTKFIMCQRGVKHSM